MIFSVPAADMLTRLSQLRSCKPRARRRVSRAFEEALEPALQQRRSVSCWARHSLDFSSIVGTDQVDLIAIEFEPKTGCC